MPVSGTGNIEGAIQHETSPLFGSPADAALVRPKACVADSIQEYERRQIDVPRSYSTAGLHNTGPKLQEQSRNHECGDEDEKSRSAETNAPAPGRHDTAA